MGVGVLWGGDEVGGVGMLWGREEVGGGASMGRGGRGGGAMWRERRRRA